MQANIFKAARVCVSHHHDGTVTSCRC